MLGCRSVNKAAADEHNQALDQIIDELIDRKISYNVASMRLRELGYNFHERWAMIDKHDPSSKVIKLK